MRTLATYSIKGGVGKTTAAVNLAYAAGRTGARVLLWDLDPQGAATYFYRVKQRIKGGAAGIVDARQATRRDLAGHVRESDVAGVHLLPADFSLRHLDLHLQRLDGDRGDHERARRRLGDLLAPLAGDYDVALLDCPAGITLASEAVFQAADALLVPSVPTPLSVRTLDPLVSFLDAESSWGARHRPQVWPFVSMYDWQKAMHRKLLERLDTIEPRFFRTAVPNSTAVERMGILRQPVGQCAPRTTAARSYQQLWDEIATRLWA